MPCMPFFHKWTKWEYHEEKRRSTTYDVDLANDRLRKYIKVTRTRECTVCGLKKEVWDSDKEISSQLVPKIKRYENG